MPDTSSVAFAILSRWLPGPGGGERRTGALGKTCLARGCGTASPITDMRTIILELLWAAFVHPTPLVISTWWPEPHRATRSVTAISLILMRHPQRQHGTGLLVTAAHACSHLLVGHEAVDLLPSTPVVA